MKVELIENAIDSLQIAMNAFTIWNNEFESKHNFRNLTQRKIDHQWGNA